MNTASLNKKRFKKSCWFSQIFNITSANLSDTIRDFAFTLQYWQLQSDNYTQKQISEMPNWINAQNDSFQEHEQLFQGVDIDLFRDEQRLPKIL